MRMLLAKPEACQMDRRYKATEIPFCAALLPRPSNGSHPPTLGADFYPAGPLAVRRKGSYSGVLEGSRTFLTLDDVTRSDFYETKSLYSLKM